MSIQFRCPGCSQPIEVDDPFAGKSAQCPYCRRVITVPEKTSLDAAALIEARPSPDAPQSPGSLAPPPLPPAAGSSPASGGSSPASGGSYGSYSQPDPYGRPPYDPQRPPSVHDRGRSGAAQLTGNLALALTALTVVLFVTCIVLMAPVFSHMARNAASQPVMTQEQAEQLFRDSGVNMQALSLVSFAMQFTLLAGLILGVVSWWQKPASNWRAWTSVGVNGIFIFCACSAIVLTVAIAAAGAR